MKRKSKIYKVDEKLSVEFNDEYWKLQFGSSKIQFPLKGHYEHSNSNTRKFVFLLYMPSTEFIKEEAEKAKETGVISDELLPMVIAGVKWNYAYIIDVYCDRRRHQRGFIG